MILINIKPTMNKNAKLKKSIALKIQVVKYNIIRLGEKQAVFCKDGVFSEKKFLKDCGSGYLSLNRFLQNMLLDEDGKEIDYTMKRLQKVLNCNKVDLLQIKLYDEV